MPSYSALARLVALKSGAHWLTAPAEVDTPSSPDLARLRSFFVAEPTDGGYHLRSLRSDRPLLRTSTGVAFGSPGETGTVFPGPLQTLPSDPALSPFASTEATAAAPAAASLVDQLEDALAIYAFHPVSFWEDNEHLSMVTDAITTALRFASQPGQGRLQRFWANNTFQTNLKQGLHDADYVSPYNNPIWGIGTYSSHFFDPDSLDNYFGHTVPTAMTEGTRYAYASADRAVEIEQRLAQGVSAASLNSLYAACGYRLGLALHYCTDLSQPMHAANFINFPFTGDWRHQAFETYAETNGGNYRRDPAGVAWSEVDPSTHGNNVSQVLMNIARGSKTLYTTQVARLLAAKEYINPSSIFGVSYINTWGSEANPVLQDAIPRGQLGATTFLLNWERITLAWSNPATVVGAHSAWAPNFLVYRGRQYFVFSDSSDGYKIKLQPMDYNFPTDVIKLTDQVSTATANETPACTVIGDLLLIAWHQKGNNDLYCAWTTSLDSTWTSQKVANASVRSNTQPALATLAGRALLFWADTGAHLKDEALCYLQFTPTATTPVGPLMVAPGMDSHNSPTLTVFNHQIYGAWQGIHSSEPIFYSTFDWYNGWDPQKNLKSTSATTSKGPALAVAGGVMVLFFRWDSNNIYFTQTTDGNAWTAAAKVPTQPTESKQDMTALGIGDSIYFGWNNNWGMYYSIVGDGSPNINLPDGSVVQEGANTTMYIICGDAKFIISSPQVLAALGYQPRDVRNIPSGILSFLPSVPADGSVYKELSSATIYVSVGGAKLAFSNAAECATLMAGRQPTVLPDGATAALPTLPKDDTVIKVLPGGPQNPANAPDSAWQVYTLVEGKRMLMPSSTSNYGAYVEGAEVAPYAAVMALPSAST